MLPWCIQITQDSVSLLLQPPVPGHLSSHHLCSHALTGAHNVCLPSAHGIVAVALILSPVIGMYCQTGDLLCNHLKVGLPTLPESRHSSALKVTKENTRSTETTSRSSTNPILLPGCYDYQSDMQIVTPCVVTMGMRSTEWQFGTNSLML